jgi:tetratricopeptide (TPR) repeat protein
MEAWVKLSAGLALLMASIGYLYRPQWVLRWNEWGRKALFNDAFVLHHRRRWGLAFFLAAVLFFYSGFINLAHLMSRENPSGFLELHNAYAAFRAQQYRGAVVRCQEILKRDDDNVNAWCLLGASWSALGRKDQARKAWERVLARDPSHPVGQNHLLHLGPPAVEPPPEARAKR